jgi:hypothetical protein
MSRISKEATTEYLGANTESSTFEDHKNALLSPYRVRGLC